MINIKLLQTWLEAADKTDIYIQIQAQRQQLCDLAQLAENYNTMAWLYGVITNNNAKYAQITNYISFISIILNPCFVFQSSSEIISMEYCE